MILEAEELMKSLSRVAVAQHPQPLFPVCSDVALLLSVLLFLKVLLS